jgi:hypothetical protein
MPCQQPKAGAYRIFEGQTMTATDHVSHYVVLKTTDALWNSYKSGDATKVRDYIAKNLRVGEKFVEHFSVVALPSNHIRPVEGDEGGANPEDRPEQLVAGLNIDTESLAEEFQAAIRSRRDVFVGSGADLPFSGADHWCPQGAADATFGDRAAVESLLQVPYVRDTKKLTGAGVNVVIVDQGLDASALGASYGGGWKVNAILPGSTKPLPGATHRTHGMMVAHNVLSVAPDATVFDLPMLPSRIGDIPVFLHTAHAAYLAMLQWISQQQANGKLVGPWVLINAWAIFDRQSEIPPGSYTNSPRHPFNELVARAVDSKRYGKKDVIFCAGNCGQFCADGRCGATDQGPGRSIFGANCHPEVLSVGAVRADTMWLGYSSQGPGQPGFWPQGRDKPDLCAPSQFSENNDAHTTNGGTSAASALAGAVIAALRSNSKWNTGQVPPGQLKQILNDTARKTYGPAWSPRTGNGILDARKAFDELARQFP